MLQGARKKVAVGALSAAAAAIGASQANASVIIDIRATSVTGAGSVGSAGKSVTGVANGSVINYEVHALVQATTADVIATQPDTAPEGFQAAAGVIKSDAGTLALNLTHALQANFAGLGSQASQPSDLDADTDLDWGTQAAPSNANTTVILYRSGSMTVGNSTGVSDFLIGSGTMTVTDASKAQASVNFILGSTKFGNTRPDWQENGTFVSRQNSNAVASVGAPITVSGGAVPEPASLGLLALGATSLLRRRRA